MPSKKKKYNARFPAGRIKKIMQSDEEIGKVAQAVPVIISRTLELFVESLLTKTLRITNSRNAKTLSPSHMKQCIMAEQRFDFLRELVKNIPDISVAEEAANYNDEEVQSSPEEQYPDSDTPFDLSMPSTSASASRNAMMNTRTTNGVAFQNGNNNRNIYRRSASEHVSSPRSQLKREHETMHQIHRGMNPGNHSATSSVIMHTTALANLSGSSTESIPHKMSRSDSTPVHSAAWSSKSQSPHIARQRLKHQPHSLPIQHESTYGGYSKTTCTPPKQTPHPATNLTCGIGPQSQHPHQRSHHTSPPTKHAAAMPAPVVSFNFTNDPIINIDLSNIVAGGKSVNTALTPAVATISIGSPLPANAAAAYPFPQNSSSNSDLAPSLASSKLHPKANAMPATTRTSSVTSNVTAAVGSIALLSSKSSSCLDLDEDYDNI